MVRWVRETDGRHPVWGPTLYPFQNLTGQIPQEMGHILHLILRTSRIFPQGGAAPQLKLCSAVKWSQ